MRALVPELCVDEKRYSRAGRMAMAKASGYWVDDGGAVEGALQTGTPTWARA